jgi:hypothetical protein
MMQRINTLFCSVLLLTMSFAVGLHWWTQQPHRTSVSWLPALRLATTLPPHTPPAATTHEPQRGALPEAEPPALAQASTAEATPHTAPLPAAQQEFYQSLIQQIDNLQNQNRDLVDQLAETNRELMKLEFRVDTHSSQFRPLPVHEERQDTTLDESSSILPPRPIIVDEGFLNE